MVKFVPVRANTVIVTLFPLMLHETLVNPRTAEQVAVELTVVCVGKTIDILSPTISAVLGVIVTK